MKRALILLTFIGTLVGGVVLYAATHITTTGTAPAVCNVGDIFMKTGASAGFYRCSAANTWTRLPDVGGTDFAPTNAQYWTGAADGTLSAEKNLGALSTGLVINTAGVPSAYGGSACAASNFVSSVDASGAVTCAVPSGTGAPTSATYITQTPDGTLSAEQALSALSTGIMKVTTGTGVVSSLAIPLVAANGGTDNSSATDDNVLVGSGAAWVLKAVPDCDDAGGNHLNYDTGTNAFSCGTSSSGGGGSSALSAITAATTTNTIASGNNFDQIWNWAITTAAKSGITWGETTAATNGGTAASANQSIGRFATLSTSTALPLIIDNFGAAPSLRVNDVASDTTPFCVDSGGNVQINGNSTGTSGCSPTSNLDIQGSNGSYTTYWYDGTDTIGIFSDTNKAGIGTKSTHMMSLFANNSNPRLAVHTGGAIDLFRRQSAVTSLSTGSTGHDQYYLIVGGDEFGTNAYQLIGFGYDGTTNCDVCGTPPPAAIGFFMTSTTSNTKGSLIFMTRDVTTDTAPSLRMTINSAGNVLVEDLKTTGSAGSKNVVCVDTSTGRLYASSTGTDCSN